MKFSSQKAYGGALGLALLAVILVAANAIVSQLRLRKDLTAEKLYTLSDGSRKVLATLQEPVTLKFFFSRSSGDIDVFVKTYASQVEDLLREYVRAADGKLALEVYDPAPDSDEEEWAQKYGIEPQVLGMDVPPMYFGLAAVSADGETELVLPGLSPRTESTLEYDITRMVTRVANPKKPVVGVLSTLPVLGGADDDLMAAMMRRQQPQQPWYAFRELKRDADVRTVAKDATTIDPEIRTLVVVHPKDLPEKTQYAIDQFVLRGGRLIVFVDPLSLFDAMNSQQNQMMMMGGPSFSSSLDKLFSAWGVTFESGRIVADMQYPTALRGQSGPEENPTFLSLTKSAFKADDMLVSQWGSIILPFAGSFTFTAQEGLAATPLIQTSDSAGLVDPMSAQFGAQAIRSQFVADGVRRTLVARLDGTFKTAFPDGAPKEEAEKPEGEAEDKPAAPAPGEHLASGKSLVVLFADSDLLQDDVCVRVNQMFGFSMPTLVSDNINLFVSAVEQASGDSALLAVRSRGRTTRPYTVVDGLERKAQLAFLEKEKELEGKLDATRQRLSDLQSQKTGAQSRNILSPEQQAEIERFREEEHRFRRELKEVRKNLRSDIEALGVRVKALNILAVPLLVGALGIVQGIRRRRV